MRPTHSGWCTRVLGHNFFPGSRAPGASVSLRVRTAPPPPPTPLPRTLIAGASIPDDVFTLTRSAAGDKVLLNSEVNSTLARLRDEVALFRRRLDLEAVRWPRSGPPGTTPFVADPHTAHSMPPSSPGVVVVPDPGQAWEPFACKVLGLPELPGPYFKPHAVS